MKHIQNLNVISEYFVIIVLNKNTRQKQANNA